MDSFTTHSLSTTPHNLTYAYYLSPDFRPARNTAPSTPTLLFLHGFPDNAQMWAGVMPTLLQLPYPILALDLLGFGGSAKPADARLYAYKAQADAIAQILEAEGVVGNVIPVGHDWGSAVAQRFYLYHKEVCVGLSLLSLAYQVPSPDPFDLEKANEKTAERFGYPQWEYWNFFTAPDAPKLLHDNLTRFFDVNNGHYPSLNPEEAGRDIWMREQFCTPGAMRAYITGTGKYANYNVPLKAYPNLVKVKQAFIERLSRDGLEGPVNYYHSLKDNVMLEDERALCGTPGDAARRIEVPVLYIGQMGDWVCRTDLMKDAKELGLVGDLEERAVEAGHWVLYEKPEEIAELLREWLVRRFPVGA